MKTRFERAESEVNEKFNPKASGLFARLTLASKGHGVRSCCDHESPQKEESFANLGESVDFGQHTPHMLVCESPGHCKCKANIQTVEDSIREAACCKKLKREGSVLSETSSILGSVSKLYPRKQHSQVSQPELEEKG